MGLLEWLPSGVYGLALATALAFGAFCAFGRRKSADPTNGSPTPSP